MTWEGCHLGSEAAPRPVVSEVGWRPGPIGCCVETHLSVGRGCALPSAGLTPTGGCGALGRARATAGRAPRVSVLSASVV